MNRIGKRAIMIALVAVFVSGALLTPAMTLVFAAEQTTSQEQQGPPADTSQDGNNEHAGHHSSNK